MRQPALLQPFLRGRAKDKCLREFEGLNVTLENINGQLTKGNLRVETTGLEFTYSTPIMVDNIATTSSILYKEEYSQIQAVIAFHEDLSENNLKKRAVKLKRTYQPSIFRILRRKIRNTYNTIKDSVFEIINAVIGQVQKTKSAGAILSSQNKHVNKFQENIKNVEGASFEPLLEPLIGKRVLLESAKDEKTIYFDGILKDYTSRFIEVIDVKYQVNADNTIRNADVVVPRSLSTVRGLTSEAQPNN